MRPCALFVIVPWSHTLSLNSMRTPWRTGPREKRLVTVIPVNVDEGVYSAFSESCSFISKNWSLRL